MALWIAANVLPEGLAVVPEYIALCNAVLLIAALVVLVVLARQAWLRLRWWSIAINIILVGLALLPVGLIAFFVGKLGFTLVEDTVVPEQAKRWVVVTPPGANESRLLLAKASNEEQKSRIGSQTGGRVFLFLHTDDLWRDYERYKANGIVFVREPKREPYGTVAVFKDLYGNLWDLLEPSDANRSA